MEAILLTKNLLISDFSNVLLFIDEIQEQPKAIKLLRYFYEDFPELHVIAAGSLLEFALKDVSSFPVGRVQYLYLNPFTFEEFLEALNKKVLIDSLRVIPISEVAHPILIQLFHEYVIVGGMPEIVNEYAKKQSITALISLYEGIWTGYINDVSKYAMNDTLQRVIKHVISSASMFVDQRVKLQNFGGSNYRSREVKEAFRNLEDAGLVQLIYPTTETDLPIRRNFNKSPRMQFLDVGLINYSLQIQAQLLSMSDFSSAFKGAIIPQIIQQELISSENSTKYQPVFWVRDKTQSDAEVDLIYPFKGIAIPVEIKSGPIGKLRSLHQFIDTCDHSFAIRIYAGKFSIEQQQTPAGKPFTLMNLPYYLGSKLKEYVSYLIEQD